MMNTVEGGVTLDELRAAVALSRSAADPDAHEWSWSTWCAVWEVLSPPQQRVVYLVVLVGMSQQRVAGELGCTRAVVAGTWRRALDRIRAVVPAGA